jgi:predicted HicB family RNase H-like nuclease
MVSKELGKYQMNDVFEYAGYIGSAEVDSENDVLFGRLLYIRDVIGYHGNSVSELKAAFREAVDDYLAVCEEEGTEADKPCKGSFNVRVGPERHRRVAIAARVAGVGLNEFVAQAIDSALEPKETRIIHNHQWVMVAGEQRTASTGDPTKLTLMAAPLSVVSDVKH